MRRFGLVRSTMHLRRRTVSQKYYASGFACSTDLNAENAVDPAMAPSTGPSVYVHAGDGPSAEEGPDASMVTSRGPMSLAGFMPQPETGPVTKMSRPTMDPSGTAPPVPAPRAPDQR